MRMVRLETLCSAVAWMSLWSCAGDTLVGENTCYGDRVVCKSDAPSLGPAPLDSTPPGSAFDVVASRTVAPTWVYELPPDKYLPQVAPAPDGGVWTAFIGQAPAAELQRIDAEGKLVASYPVSKYGALHVDGELNPRILSAPGSGQVGSFSVSGQGEVSEHTIDVVQPNDRNYNLVAPAPDGGVRVGLFRAQGSYVAEFDPAGDLLWKQSDIRDARDFPYEDLGAGLAPVVSYGLVPLSDGALAVGVPKYVDNVPGFTIGRTQGITVLEADGNVRWDFWLGSKPSFTLLMTPGLDGSLIVTDSALTVANGFGDSALVEVLDRDGGVAARWVGRRAEYYSVTAKSLCSDAVGDIYIAVFTGQRDAVVPTVCRMRSGDPSAEVVCVAVDGVAVDGVAVDGVAVDGLARLSTNVAFLMASMTSPEPGAVVFTVQNNSGAQNLITLVRVDF